MGDVHGTACDESMDKERREVGKKPSRRAILRA